MKKENKFFMIFIGTIILTRIFLLIYPISSPMIEGFRIHHYMYGIIIILFATIFKKINLFAIGLGLFLDELMLILTNSWTHTDYFSVITISGTIIFSIMVFIFRKKIYGLIKKPIPNS